VLVSALFERGVTRGRHKFVDQGARPGGCAVGAGGVRGVTHGEVLCSPARCTGERCGCPMHACIYLESKYTYLLTYIRE